MGEIVLQTDQNVTQNDQFVTQNKVKVINFRPSKGLLEQIQLIASENKGLNQTDAIHKLFDNLQKKIETVYLQAQEEKERDRKNFEVVLQTERRQTELANQNLISWKSMNPEKITQWCSLLGCKVQEGQCARCVHTLKRCWKCGNPVCTKAQVQHYSQSQTILMQGSKVVGGENSKVVSDALVDGFALGDQQ